MKQILLTTIALSGILLADFTRSDSIVTDSVTGLQWQDEPYTNDELTAYNNNTENGKVLFWQTAITYCENLTLDSYDDWRLPNLNELKSLVDRTKSNPVIVNGFVNSSSNDYWSSTTNVDYSNFAWIVFFDYGNVSYNYKDDSYYVRCVRAGE